MLSGERQLEIINIIRESGVAEVEYLAKTLGVSTMTIRRDLKKLDESGLIERCYGGAVRKTEVTYEAKRIKNHESKIKSPQMRLSMYMTEWRYSLTQAQQHLRLPKI